MKMKEKKLMMMTSFGPVLYDTIKAELPKEIVELIEANKEELMAKAEPVVPMSVGYYIARLARRMGWKPEKMAGYLSSLYEINPALSFAALLREVAIELDEKYEDHINNCEELYIISTMDGRTHKVPRAHIKNFRNFAAFRTLEDAKTACRILRDDLKAMFKSGRK